MVPKHEGTPNTPPVDETGTGGERHDHAGGSHPRLTTNQGIPVSDNQNSLRDGAPGPTLLEDFILREKITHFDHERIPERVVHARGSGAHGVFRLTHSLSAVTRAAVLTRVGEDVPVFCRFSTVAGGAGSVDTPRDVRGFAVKFYTDEGNWDLVSNNIPVFFVQDALKFPDLVHAVKMEPDRAFPQASSAHDTFWDFISLMPESMHMILWAMSDRTLPRSYRMMEGFGVHSFKLVNADGEVTFAKFHWRPRLGIQSTVWDEAMKLQAADNDFHRRDLFEAIQAGQYPEWDLGVQLFTEAEARNFPFDHLDSTKLVPEELSPLIIIGRMTLNRWPDNFFAETEQVAFCPANIVPGIDFSDDPLLQGRLFSYLDTQLSRLGSPNFHQIPINAPRCPIANLQRDGHMQMAVPKGRVNYEPSSLQDDSPRECPATGFRSHPAAVGPTAKSRVRPESFGDHYSQARMFYRSQTPVEQDHIAGAFVFELSKVETPRIRAAMVGHLQHVDAALADRVARGLGLDGLPPPAQTAWPPIDMAPSAHLTVVGRMIPTLEGRAVGLLIDHGSDAEAVSALRRAIEAAGATVKIIAPKIGGATLSDDSPLPADMALAAAPSVLFDAVALVLAPAAAERLGAEACAIDFLRDAFGHLKAIGHDDGAKRLIDEVGSISGAGVMPLGSPEAFIRAAAQRYWDREPLVRPRP